MKQNHLNLIKKKLAKIDTLQLRGVTRAADMLCLQFGNLIEKDTLYRDDQGKAAIRKELAGEFALHIQCSFHWIFGDSIILAKGDLYQPASSIRDHIDYEHNDFDYDLLGNNRMDESIAANFRDIQDFFVQAVSVTKVGNIKVKFTNGCVLEVFVDVAGPEECWGFFRFGEDEHIIVNGYGLAIKEG